MPSKFHQRFDLPVDRDEAERRFVNRIWNEVYGGLVGGIQLSYRHIYVRDVATALGEHYRPNTSIQSYTGPGLLRNLEAVEALYDSFPKTDGRRKSLDNIVRGILDRVEIDLGVRWESGRFVRAGAASLDDGLVNGPLGWLSSPRFEAVRAPYAKGIEHFLRATARPELLSDVITDMYESVEALAKIITGRDKDLSANRESFLRDVNASDEYKAILKEYIAFANAFRHGAGESKPKPPLTVPEVESFVYLTGIFIRLAMQLSQPAREA